MLAEALGERLRNMRAWLRRFTLAERLLALLLAVLMVATVYFGAVELHRQARAREALAQVKAARLAASAVGASYYANGRAFADQTTATGFAAGVDAEIIQLGQLPGQVYLLEIGENGYTVTRLLYQEDDMYALYDAADGYTVWRGEQRLTYQAGG